MDGAFLLIMCILPGLALGQTEDLDEATTDFNNADTDKDGKLTLKEYPNLYNKYKKQKTDEITCQRFVEYNTRYTSDMFNAYDINQDGVLTDTDFKEIFKTMDTNKNQKATLEEFRKYVESLKAKKT
ncbi:uncharacterized protein LOC131950138 [Physella acuta]|uniref:uncharacterized protein LOC131950138 n=1 Tax=Physella acuta TaxID=109671 RepID=UPI0027DB3B0E|nr:uncharacterized protein LOC131950138 [Physella acuta]